MDTEVETTRAKHPSVLRKGLAAVVLVVAVALILKLLIGFVIGIFWVVVAVALVVAVLWALKTLVW
jgi:uncharacterized membrane protein YgaE (UPF0421/DUF939 family)